MIAVPDIVVPPPVPNDVLPLKIPVPVAVSNCPDGIVKPPFVVIAPVTANVPSTVVPEFALPMVVAPVPVELLLIFTV